MVSVAGRCPPLGVHPFGSDVRLRLSSRPVVQPSGVQPSGVRSSGWVVRDPAVRPTGVHPSVRSPLSRPGQPRGGLGITSVRRVTFTTRTDRDACVCGVRAARSTARVGLRGRRGGGRGGGRGSVGRGAGRVCSGASCGAVDADRPGASPAGGPPVAAGYPEAWERGLQCGVPAPAGGGERGLDPRLRCVVVVEPDDRVDGPGRVNELDGADEGAAPARPSQEVSEPTSGRQRYDLRERWWARQGLNL